MSMSHEDTSESMLGHNGAHAPRQWQTPHGHTDTHPHSEPDIDLVEKALCEALATASDPTSLLRLACVPFVGETAEGQRLVLLRVEQDGAVDIGSVTPTLGGASFRYAPLPARLASRRNCLRLIYFDGGHTLALTLDAARALADRSQEPSACVVAHSHAT